MIYPICGALCVAWFVLGWLAGEWHRGRRVRRIIERIPIPDPDRPRPRMRLFGGPADGLNVPDCDIVEVAMKGSGAQYEYEKDETGRMVFSRKL